MQPSSFASSDSLEHSRLISLINSMSDAVMAIDQQARIVLYNAATLNILDLNITIQNKSLREVLKIFDKDDNPIDIESIVLQTQIPITSRDYLLHYTDGSKSNLYLNIAPVRHGYGQSGGRGFVLVLRDITREKSLEEERDEFISVVSHELRTPITIAEGNLSNAQLIADKSGDIAQIKQALKAAHDQIVFLADMFNDLATLSRAERGRLTVEVSAINAHDLIEHLVKTYELEAKLKGLKMITDLDPNLELLQSSELYVREILQNFITNSLKYTQSGQITVGAHAKPGGIEFRVSDTGIGISKGDQAKVFSKFFRSEDYRTRSTNGTGLGLYITQKLANLLRAQLTLESELNKGSAFKIFVPDFSQVPAQSQSLPNET